MLFEGLPLMKFCRDPRFIREFKAKHCVEVFVEHVPTKKKCVHTTTQSLHLLIIPIGRNFGGARISPSLTTLTKSRFGYAAFVCARIRNWTRCEMQVVCILHVPRSEA